MENVYVLTEIEKKGITVRMFYGVKGRPDDPYIPIFYSPEDAEEFVRRCGIECILALRVTVKELKKEYGEDFLYVVFESEDLATLRRVEERVLN